MYLSFLILLLSTWLWPPSPTTNFRARKGECKTSFVVTSCGQIPVSGATITILTDQRKRYRVKTNKDGIAMCNYCLLANQVPKVLLKRSQRQQEKMGQRTDRIQITENLEYLPITDSTYMYQSGETVYYFDQNTTENFFKVKMRYRAHRLRGKGVSHFKYPAKMNLTKKLMEQFFVGKCRFEDGVIICGISICS